MIEASSTAARKDQELSTVLRGLSSMPPRVAPRYFYDAVGSSLFAKITETPEYYPTRTELAILRERGRSIAQHVPAGASVIELGSGSGDKVLALLTHLDKARIYRPIEISASALAITAEAVRSLRPDLDVRPFCGDFMDVMAYSGLPSDAPKLVYYSGSTIGNFDPPEQARFLRHLRAQLAPGDVLLLATDLVKDEDVLNAAYNDAAGYTAAFNKNMLAHLNTRFGASFVPEAFDHVAFYNPSERRIEMHLSAREPQRVSIGTETLTFTSERPIHTESSYKFQRDDLESLAQKTGFELVDMITDDRGWFAESVFRVGDERIQ